MTTTEPNDKQKEETRGPERIRVCVRHGKDDWIGIAYSPSAGDPSAIHEYVSASLLSSRDTEIRNVLEGLASEVEDYGPCWCSSPLDAMLDERHAPACLAARALWERVRD